MGAVGRALENGATNPVERNQFVRQLRHWRGITRQNLLTGRMQTTGMMAVCYVLRCGGRTRWHVKKIDKRFSWDDQFTKHYSGVLAAYRHDDMNETAARKPPTSCTAARYLNLDIFCQCETSCQLVLISFKSPLFTAAKVTWLADHSDCRTDHNIYGQRQ